jgi:Rrf2 family protein
MKISYKGDYAIKALLDLALNHKGEEKVFKITDMSKRLDIPLKFLEAVLLNLKKGGFVKSKRGKEGGYYLAKQPVSISLGNIVRYIEGPIEPIACVDDCYKGCKDSKECVIKNVWKKTTHAVSEIIDNISLEDLANQSRQKRQVLHYYI